MLKRCLGALTLLFVIMLFATPPYSGEIYKWRDASGVMHYSDAPPDDVEAESFHGYKLDEDSEKHPPNGEQPAKKGAGKTSGKGPARAGGGMLWKIEGRGDRPSFILGTIHSGDQRVLRLRDAVRRSFDQAVSFSMEVKMDASALMQSATAMYLTDGRTLEDILGSALYEDVVRAMAPRGVPESMLRLMKPWAVIVMLNKPPSSSMIFLDTMLYQLAVEQNKEVHGLETPAEQLGVFESMSMDEQVAMLESTLRRLPEMSTLIEEMIQAYVADDLLKLANLGMSAMKESGGVDDRFIKRINDDRNRRMVERMMPRLEEGGAFVAVGALHLPFETGILNLLEGRGFTVSPGG